MGWILDEVWWVVSDMSYATGWGSKACRFWQEKDHVFSIRQRLAQSAEKQRLDKPLGVTFNTPSYIYIFCDDISGFCYKKMLNLYLNALSCGLIQKCFKCRA